MKKNLRIVSAAAAALLAVAPIAASAVSTVNADTTASTAANATTGTHYTNINLGGANIATTTNPVDLTPSLTLAGKNGNINGSLTGTISATLGGQSYTANLASENGSKNVTITAVDKDGKAGNTVEAKDLEASHVYNVAITNVGFNFGSQNAGKTVTIMSSNPNVTFAKDDPKNNNIDITDGKTAKVTLSQNGTVSGLTVNYNGVTAFDTQNTNNVVFYNIATGQPVTAGNAMVLANAQGQLNYKAIVPAIRSNLIAVQSAANPKDNNVNGNGSYNPNTINTIPFEASDLIAQLKAQNITVDANGNFVAPHTFTVKVKATSNVNGKSAELPVTVTVANVAEKTVDSVSKTIMHNAYYYNKDAQRVGTDKITRYNSVTVLPTTTTINGKAYYQVVENGKAVDKYINADNIDGTKRTLKHNAYVYATSKKRANKVTLKKGDVVTTYGAAYKFANGKMYYKINNDTNKTYVKVANF